MDIVSIIIGIVDDEVGSVYYHTLNKEFGKFDTHRRRYYYYDLAIPSIKLIIEYHGDLYHGLFR